MAGLTCVWEEASKWGSKVRVGGDLDFEELTVSQPFVLRFFQANENSSLPVNQGSKVSLHEKLGLD